MPHKPLALHEEILLLALNDEKGTVISGTWYGLALGGAILSELLLRGHVEVDIEGKKSFLKLKAKKPLGDDVLDEALEKVAHAKRRATAQTWVTRFSAIKNLRHRVARQLCEKRILRADERQILLFFKQRVYPERNHGPERAIISRLKDAIFSSGRNADPRTIVLLSLAHSSGLLPALFDKKRLRSRKEHIEKLLQGATLGNATKEAIQSAQVALMMTAIFPAVFVTTIAHN